ncbi:hypothetical protein DFH28DRAFT_1139530 [Melampsora americana]|nr:hypothetical protein DFH28DRAFT_1139530 [Melampsora americana]
MDQLPHVTRKDTRIVALEQAEIPPTKKQISHLTLMASRFTRKKGPPKQGRDSLSVALEIGRKSPTPEPTSVSKEHLMTTPPNTIVQKAGPAGHGQVKQASQGNSGVLAGAAPTTTKSGDTCNPVPAPEEPLVPSEVPSRESSPGEGEATSQPPIQKPAESVQAAPPPADEVIQPIPKPTNFLKTKEADKAGTPHPDGKKLTADEVRDQIQGLKSLHVTWSDGIETFIHSRSAGAPAVTGELEDMQQTLRRIKYSLSQKQLELEELTRDQQEEIIFCGEIVRAPSPATQSKPVLPKFKRVVRTGKPKDHSNVSARKFVDDEAKESNKFEGSATTLQKRRRVLSNYYVDTEDEEEDAKERAREKRQAEKDKENKNKKTTVYIEDAVNKGRTRTKKNKVEVDKDSPFFIKKIDLRNLTPDELKKLSEFEAALPSPQFNWGTALAGPVGKIVSTWAYDEDSEHDKVKSKDLTSILTFLKDVNDDKLMITGMKTAPRLMQLSADDPYFIVDSFNWNHLQDSESFEWDQKNGFLRALHGMACRTSSDTEWTSVKSLMSNLLNGYRLLQSMLDEALKHVSFDTSYQEHSIKPDEEDAPEELTSIVGAMSWLYAQVVMNKRPGDESKKSVIKGPGLSHLQKKYFEVLIGITVVYEWDIMNRTLQDCIDEGRPAKDLSAIKKLQKKETCLKDIVKKHIRQNTGTDEPKMIEQGTSQPSLAQTALVKVREAEVVKNERQALSDIRKDALQALSLFLTYGTAGLIHIWPVSHDQVMHDGCYLIKMSSIFAERRSPSNIHVYGERAWSRLDNNMFKCLQSYVTPGGRFRRNIKWSDMVSNYFKTFRLDKISHMYVLDMGSEVLMPRTSRGLNGSICPTVSLPDVTKMKITAPDSEPLRKVFTVTEGQPLALGEGGSQMYSGLVSDGRVKRPVNDVTILQKDRKKARVTQDERRKSKGVIQTNSDLEDEENSCKREGDIQVEGEVDGEDVQSEESGSCD